MRVAPAVAEGQQDTISPLGPAFFKLILTSRKEGTAIQFKSIITMLLIYVMSRKKRVKEATKIQSV